MNYRFFLILCTLWTSACTPIVSQNQFALLVGISDYPEKSGWSNLASENDVHLFRETLIHKGFSNRNIKTLLNNKATKEGIINAINKNLIDQLKIGDLAFFHFSGHGQQVFDNNKDEIDGLDEALVPFDSPKFFKKNVYEGQQLLRDDELEKLFNTIRNKIGPTGQLIISIDACHSGSTTRGKITARGTNVIMADSTFITPMKNQIGNQPNDFLDQNITNIEPQLSGITAFFSCRPNQLSYEYRESNKRYGLFSYAFCTALSTIDYNTTYEALFEQLKITMSTYTLRQSPVIIGNLEQIVFGNKFIQQHTYFSVERMIATNLLLINGGAINGLTPKSEVVFYPQNTKDTSLINPIGYGIVQAVSLTNADVRIENNINLKSIKNACVFIKSLSYGDLEVNLSVAMSNKKLSNQLKAQFQKCDYVNIVSENATLFLENESGLAGGSISLYQNDDHKIWSIKDNQDSEEIYALLLKPIQQYIQAAYLRSLTIDSPSYKGEIKVLVKDNNHYIPVNNPILEVGTDIRIQITNTGSAPFYFCLIDILPDHTISNIFPGTAPAIDYFLEPGKSFTSDEFEIENPKGLDILKLITTKQPLNLHFLRAANNSPKSPFEKLMIFLLDPETKQRGASQLITDFSGAVSTLIIEIE